MKRFKKHAQYEPNNEIIVQHNYLIEARYYLTLQEKRLMYWLASQAQPNDEDFKEHGLAIKELSNLIGVKGDHLYKAIDTITHNLIRKIITIREIDNKSFTKAALLGGAKYQTGQGIIKLSFHPYLKPYMLQIKERFTQIRLGDVLGLKSTHSIRIYEILKQYQSVGERTISLKDLREFCGITEEQYEKYNNFKKDVLERGKKEINKKTDILIDYMEVKTSRKVTAIIFNIKANSTYGITEFEKMQLAKADIIEKELRSDQVLAQSLLEYGFSKSKAKQMIESTAEEVLKNAIRCVDIQIERGNVKNAKAMIQKAINEQWHPKKYKDNKIN